jgi:hypothetical protein
MWDQYMLDLYWASKAVFGVACPNCHGLRTLVQVEPHPNGSLGPLIRESPDR